MATIGSLIVNVVAQTGQFVQGLNKARSGLGSLQKSFTSFITSASGLGTILGAGALGAGLRSCVNDFLEDERAAKLLDSQIRATGEAAGIAASTIRDMSSSLQETTRFADETTNAAAGVLLSFKAIKGDTFKAAMVAAQDLSTVMGQDLQTSVVQLGKALQDPVKGLTSLRKIGVAFTDDQKALIKSLVAANDVLGAQKIILEELNSEFGGAAAADATSYAGQIDVLKNRFGELKESIGGIAPVAADAFDELAKMAGAGGLQGITDFVNMMTGRTEGDANARQKEAQKFLQQAEALTNKGDTKGAREALDKAKAIKQTESGFDVTNAARFHESRIQDMEQSNRIQQDPKTGKWTMKDRSGPIRGTASFGGLFDPNSLKEVMKQTEEMKKAGKSMFDELMSPSEKYAKHLKELDDLLKVGAIDQATFARAKLAAAEEERKRTLVNADMEIKGEGLSTEQDAALKAYQDSLKGPNQSRPGALQAGSVEAFSASQRSQNALNDPMEKVVKSNKEIFTEAQKNNRLISDTNSGIKQLNATLGAAEVVA